MRRESFTFVVLGLALAGLGYGIAYDLATAQQSTSIFRSSERSEAIARIVDVNNGRVARKRVNAQDYQLVDVNTDLFAGDLILPEGNAVVLVQCNESGTVWRVPTGSPSGVSSGCASPDRFNFGPR
ncbi:hypothetical protein H6F93_14625 [Leptolyngbya sp. FACHB-671]|uniref:hypothetical protein n=1 Tax=Leptolyngbya sp. FACHB-671 TaxID=2692812 RepID=UPI001688B62A|nr:hypothetical protein [Leptolyngbya sp. FACHB-671]MBD2068742.1 hypothetical protein [Leptolyngbya sp. FACHB-671]